MANETLPTGEGGEQQPSPVPELPAAEKPVAPEQPAEKGSEAGTNAGSREPAGKKRLRDIAPRGTSLTEQLASLRDVINGVNPRNEKAQEQREGERRKREEEIAAKERRELKRREGLPSANGPSAEKTVGVPAEEAGKAERQARALREGIDFQFKRLRDALNRLRETRGGAIALGAARDATGRLRQQPFQDLLAENEKIELETLRESIGALAKPGRDATSPPELAPEPTPEPERPRETSAPRAEETEPTATGAEPLETAAHTDKLGTDRKAEGEPPTEPALAGPQSRSLFKRLGERAREFAKDLFTGVRVAIDDRLTVWSNADRYRYHDAQAQEAAARAVELGKTLQEAQAKLADFDRRRQAATERVGALPADVAATAAAERAQLAAAAARLALEQEWARNDLARNSRSKELYERENEKLVAQAGERIGERIKPREAEIAALERERDLYDREIEAWGRRQFLLRNGAAELEAELSRITSDAAFEFERQLLAARAEETKAKLGQLRTALAESDEQINARINRRKEAAARMKALQEAVAHWRGKADGLAQFARDQARARQAPVWRPGETPPAGGLAAPETPAASTLAPEAPEQPRTPETFVSTPAKFVREWNQLFASESEGVNLGEFLSISGSGAEDEIPADGIIRKIIAYLTTRVGVRTADKLGGARERKLAGLTKRLQQRGQTVATYLKLQEGKK